VTDEPKTTAPGAGPPIVVEPWSTEGPLLGLSIIAALFAWLLLVLSGIGLLYIGLFALFFLWVNLAFIGQVRGSAVRLSPTQFPEIYATVENLAKRMNLSPVPETYLMQAGGSLNAFATRFFRVNIVVLYSDLLVACGDNRAARDMIIAHELGHLKAGHLSLRWFLIPAAFVPFLSTALSRAREYTCDRFGLAGAGDKDGATLGLTILAAGAEHGPKVNRAELVRQRHTLAQSALMTIGEWFGTHPPLSKRIAQLDPSLTAGEVASSSGTARATALVLAIPMSMALVIWWILGSSFVQQFRNTMDSLAGRPAASDTGRLAPLPENAAFIVRTDLMNLVAFVEEEQRHGGAMPWNRTELEAAFKLRYPNAKWPLDPYSESDYGYDQRSGHFVLYSSGPDAEWWTDDDLRYDSRVKRIVVGHGLR
jgi:Zn-dependent protease with chaperone function